MFCRGDADFRALAQRSRLASNRFSFVVKRRVDCEATLCPSGQRTPCLPTDWAACVLLKNKVSDAYGCHVFVYHQQFLFAAGIDVEQTAFLRITSSIDMLVAVSDVEIVTHTVQNHLPGGSRKSTHHGLQLLKFLIHIFPFYRLWGF